MKSFASFFALRREAVLLDSWLYILKSMVAVGLGFSLGRAFAITRLDMISVLVGVMYNLEPINVVGIKGGLNQLLTSTLGAICTGILVYLMGYNVTFLTVALGMGLTLYIALKINYRMVAPTAIFTSVYMTQLLQSDALGNPSVLLTFRLRILALGLGIAVALVCNFIFSLAYYRRIARKRLEYVRIQGVFGLKTTFETLYKGKDRDACQTLLAGVFNDIEMVKANLESMLKERWMPYGSKEKENVRALYAMLLHIKTIVHLAYDCVVFDEKHTVEGKERFSSVVQRMESLDFTMTKTIDLSSKSSLHNDTKSAISPRLLQNLALMEESSTALETLSTQLK